jgi:hypothetical protein
LADRIPARLTAAEGRRFAFTVGIAFAVLGGIGWWREHLRLASGFGAVAGALLLLGLLVPAQLGPVQRAWMRLAHLISRVTAPIVMGVVYFLVISPIAVGMGLFGKRPLRVRPADTYWRARPRDKQRSDLTRQF